VGQKDARYAQLLSGPVDVEAIAVAHRSTSVDRGALSSRVEELEAKIDVLSTEIDELKATFDEFRKQFE
jgi:uncharacterized protein YceH (UPF0502 family)